MNEKEELVQELEQELKWVKYRQRMLDIIERKLIEMKQLSELARDEGLTTEELEAVNNRVKNLLGQVKAIDSESRKIEDEKTLE